MSNNALDKLTLLFRKTVFGFREDESDDDPIRRLRGDNVYSRKHRMKRAQSVQRCSKNLAGLKIKMEEERRSKSVNEPMMKLREIMMGRLEKKIAGYN